ncbi:MAG TPA: hypothetical protein VGG07_10275 [Solirubrobacteraceae bacterium]|jgi:methionyl-tRNA synthetase
MNDTCPVCSATANGTTCSACGTVIDPRTPAERAALQRAAELAEISTVYGDLRAPSILSLRQRWRTTINRLNRGR